LISTNIQAACQILNNNDLVAIPTETVYGLAANALNEKAVLKIFTLKKRPAYNPLIIHIGAIEDLDKWAKNIPEKAYLLAKTFWPGPLTLVLEKKAIVPNIITAGKNTVGIRMPNHPVTLSLLKQLNFPLAAPSANPFMSISPTTAEHVEDYFGHKLPMILEGGPCEKGIESTIIGFENSTPLLSSLDPFQRKLLKKSAALLAALKQFQKPRLLLVCWPNITPQKHLLF
jgi:L-threonylcarbamoyladenylate synthase